MGDAKQDYLVNFDEFVRVQFECSECQETTALPIEDLTSDKISEIFDKHFHAGKSNPIAVDISQRNRDKEALLSLLAHLKGIDGAMRQRNLKLRLQIKRPG